MPSFRALANTLMVAAVLATACGPQENDQGATDPRALTATSDTATIPDLSPGITPPPPPEPPDYWDRAGDFTDNLEPAPNLVGDLNGEIAFIQNTLVGPNRADKKRPLLVTDRAAYLLFFPHDRVHERLDAVIDDGRGETLTLSLNRPEHGAPSDFNNQDGRTPVVYSKRAWNAVIPWRFMHPGLSITVRDGDGLAGRLPAEVFEFGAPIELVTQHVELGMLLDPTEVPVNKWSRPGANISPELALDYFQMVPIAQFTAAQYLPIHLPKVVMPDGSVYTERSAFTGAGIYKGDMREKIAKGLISTGINDANVGVTSSFGGDQGQPRPYRQTTVHTSAGMYTVQDKAGRPVAKQVVHGLSGGGGQLTLRNTTGNEFSHEYGHDHGLGHYPGGPLSTHRRDGAWGFHHFKHRLIANLDWNGASKDESQLAYAFGKDAMAGGRPMGPISVFTLHTPFSLMQIQEKITAQSGVLAPDLPGGYARWDAKQQALVPAPVKTPRPDQIGIPVVTLVGFYDPEPTHELPSFIYPALYGNWGNVFTPATIAKHDPALAKSRCWLEVSAGDGQTLRFPLRDRRIKPKLMNQFHVNLDASVRWTKAAIRCQQDGSEIELNVRHIVPAQGELPEPVIVGREPGYTAAALRLRDMNERLVPNGYPDAATLHRAMEDYHGRIADYAPGLRIDVGRVYRLAGSYFQARVHQPGHAPTDGDPQWRKLGETAAFLSSRQLPLGEQSVDYAKTVLKGESGVFYYVPVDHVSVLSSEAYSSKSAKWYAKGNHSKLTVAAESSDGSHATIVLRGQINDRHALNRGAPVTESSRVRFRFHPEDNPDLPTGEYQVRFAAYAHGWHQRRIIEAFVVQGRITVK